MVVKRTDLIRLSVSAIILAAIVAIGFFIYSAATRPERPSVADRREALLDKLSRGYPSKRAETARNVADRQTSRVQYLNQELRERGAEWRVRKAGEEKLEIYDIS